MKIATRTLGVPVAFSPNSIAGLFAWYDASQITGQADGSALGTWTDLSSSGYNLTSSSTFQPTYYKTTAAKLINSLPAVWFSKTAKNEMQNSSVSSISTSGTVFLVNLFSSIDTSASVVFDDTNPPGSGRWEFSWAASNGGGSLATGATASLSWGTAPPTNQHLWTFGISTSSRIVRMDRSQVASDNPAGGTGLSGITVGIYNAGSGGSAGFWYDGAIGELLYYNSALSAGNITSVENYLRSKWGTP